MQARLNKMEAEMASLRSMQAAANDDPTTEAGPSTGAVNGADEGDTEGMQTDEPSEVVDSRSVYVGNVGLNHHYR